MTYRFISASNAALPEATGVVIGYIRDPKEFPFTEYCQLINSPGTTGVYYELDRDHPVRVVTIAENAWSDGDQRPSGNANKGTFHAKSFICNRYDYPFIVGEEAQAEFKRNGAFDPLVYEAKACATQAMTARVIEAMSLTDNKAAWTSINGSTFTETATNLSLGRWDVGTSTAPYFKRGLLEVARRIALTTNNAVKVKDLVFVINPLDAILLSTSQEMHDYIKSSPNAERMITGELRPNPNELYGLPSHVAGIRIVVETSMNVSSRPLSTGVDGTRGYLKLQGSGIMMSRAGGIDAPYGTRSYSTLQLYYHRYEMAVEQREDAWNKRSEGGVVDYRAIELAAPASGYYVADMTSNITTS